LARRNPSPYSISTSEFSNGLGFGSVWQPPNGKGTVAKIRKVG
jgi:hypothetical protein